MPLKLGQYADSDESSDDDVACNDAPSPPITRRSLIRSLPTPKTVGPVPERNITKEMAAGLAAIEESKTKKRKGEIVKILIPGLSEDAAGDEGEDEYVSMAQRARARQRPSGTLLSSIPKPSHGTGVQAGRKKTLAHASDRSGNSAGHSAQTQVPVAPAGKMLMPYAMKGKKERDAIIAKNKRKRASCAGATGADEEAVHDDANEFLSSLSGPSSAAAERRQLLVNGFEGNVDTSALITVHKPLPSTAQRRVEEVDVGPEVGPSGYPEAGAYPDAEMYATLPPPPSAAASIAPSELDEQLMSRHERRKRQRGHGEAETKVIDIHGASLLGVMSEHERNQVAQEQAMYNPEGQAYKAQGHEKRKNQLSYLLQKSHADKMRLSQKWAAGRANKAAAQNRYGF